jgi:predicted ATPase/class 3 adenylate cyclase
MKCPFCGADNKAGRRFCGACGQALSQRCAKCGFENQPDDRFCGGCGAALAEAPAPTPAPEPAPVEDERAERRQITVLFCDMVGSTALSQRLDPEELRDLTHRYQQACTAIIARYDGYVARYMGDGVLAYFGYPRAHEDDAERAVRAGLDMAPAMAAVHSAFPECDLRIAVRVGIATGLVVAGDIVGDGEAREQQVVGETPNLAAKLQAAAPPDAVVIAGSTRALIGETFDCDAMAPVAVKGLEAPIAAWRVLGLGRVRSRFEASRQVGLTPFVGREQEIALLLDRWRRACDGEGQVVSVCGEAGIGKSRITGALLEAVVDAPHHRLHYQCSPFHFCSALHPVAEQIAFAAGFERDDGDARRLKKLEALFGRSGTDPVRVTSLIAPLLSIAPGDRLPPLDMTPERQIDEALDALIAHVAGLAAEKPVLMVFEDLHWIDPTSLDLLDRLVGRIAGLPVLVVLTYRPDFEMPWIGEAHVTFLSLSRLGRRESAALAAGVTDRGALPDEVLAAIIARTDGVPLFVEELTRAVLEGGMLTQRDGRWALDGPLPPLAIPATLKDSLRARLDQLSTVRDVCQTASVIGRDFSFELLAAVTGRDPEPLRGDLAQLVEASLMLRHGTGEQERYSFRHALIRDAAYESLLNSRRRLLHARVASVLQARGPGAFAAEIGFVADHLSLAGMASEAAALFMQAGRQSAAKAMTREAATRFRRALAALSELPDDTERSRQMVEAHIELASTLRILGRFGDALPHLDAAEAEAAMRNDILALARVHYSRGNIYFPTGKIEECLTQHQLSYRYAQEAGSLEHEARALGGLGDAYYQRGRMLTAFDHFRRCVEISRREGFTAIEAANLHMLGWTRLYQNNLPAAIADGHAAIAVAQRAGDIRAHHFGHAVVAHLSLDRDDMEAAARHAREALTLSQKFGSKFLEAQSLTSLAMVAHHGGNADQALRLAREALALIQSTPMTFIGPRIFSVLAACTSDPEERATALAKAEEILATGSVSHNHFWFRRAAMEQALERQEWDEADRQAEALAQYTQSEPLPWSDFYCLRGRTLAAVGRGDGGPETAATLKRLQDETIDAGLLSALPKIEAAMRTTGTHPPPARRADLPRQGGG